LLVVMKFGGTSVGSAEALTKVVSIVQKSRQEGHQIVVVVSAMAGVTNLLLDAAHNAETGDEATAHQARTEIAQKHAKATLHFLGDTPERDSTMAQINTLLDEFEALCHGISVLGELTPRALDVIGGLGERMSVPQVSAILTQAGIPAQGVVASDLIVTDDRFGGAVPIIDATAEKSEAGLHPILNEGKVPVVTGPPKMASKPRWAGAAAITAPQF